MNKAEVPYVSVIKINGFPILPPIITPELRKSLLRDKQQAIKLEQRLKNCRELKRNLDELLQSHSQSTRSSPQLTFGDSSHINALYQFESPKTTRRLRNINLSKDLIEVSQYNSDGLRTICSNGRVIDSENKTDNKLACDIEETKRTFSESPKLMTKLDLDTHHSRCRSTSEPGSKNDECELEKPSTPPKPRLIRSNSYTLETPSPILLEHLKKTSFIAASNDSQNDLSDLRKAKPQEKNNHGSFESSDFSSINTVFHKEIDSKSEFASSPNKSARDIDELKSPTIEVYQTDISVQQITVNTSTVNGSMKEDKREMFFNKNPFDLFEPDSELLKVLKDIPDEYANQIVELLKKQSIEQKERLERYEHLSEATDKVCLNSEVLSTQSSCGGHKQYSSKCTPANQKSSLLELYDGTSLVLPDTPTKSNSDDLIDLTSLNNYGGNEHVEYVSCDGKPERENIYKRDETNRSRPGTTESNSTSNRSGFETLRRSSTFSLSPSQSLIYSITSDNDTLTTRLTPNFNMSDFDKKCEQGDLELGVLRQKNGFWEGFLKHESARNSCNKQLFPENDPLSIDVIKKEWAASIIGSHVRGYLTRRLIKTEKVQSLIATVKDVLICALELHHSDNIDEKDVELHRRLINQLSAALYSFHDVFFELSTADQMKVIAADRQRKLEKLKRPESGRTSARSKSFSSSRSDKSLNSSRSSSIHKLISESPSLTKV